MSGSAKKRLSKTKPKSRSVSARSTGRALKKKPGEVGEVSNRPKVTPRRRTTKPSVEALSEQVPETMVEALSLTTAQELQPSIAFPEPVLESAEATAESFPPLAEDIVTLKMTPQPVEAACLLTSDAEDKNWATPMAYQQPEKQTPIVDDSLPPVEETAFSAETKIQEPVPTPWAKFLTLLLQVWQWAQTKFKTHQVKKRLRVCESVSLGEKRFIAVIQVDGEQFLVGGSSNSVSTLAHLDKPKEFPDIFRGYEQDLSRA